ncbi:MAG: RNA polymerase sigma-70 factor [Cyclobacteriaceae bacterium]
MTNETLKVNLLKLKGGNEQAFQKIYEHYVDKLYYFTLKYVKSSAVAEDLVQSIFVKLWDIRSKINPDLSFDSFIYRITKNHTINHIRRSAFEQKFRDQLVPEYSSGEEQTANQVAFNETNLIVEKAISSLPERRQQIFRLSRLQGVDHDGIASAMGISKNTVKVQIVKATKFLREHLNQYRDVSL